MANLTAFTRLVRAHILAVPFDPLTGQTTQKSVHQLTDQLSAFASYLSTTKLSALHGFLPLFLTPDKIKRVANNTSLGCSRIPKLQRINGAIQDTITGRKLLQLQNNQKMEWQDYTLQNVINELGVEAIIAAVDTQYVDELAED